MKRNKFKWIGIFSSISTLVLAEKNNIGKNTLVKINENVSREKNLYLNNENLQEADNEKDDFQEKSNINTVDEIYSSIKDNLIFKDEENDTIVTSNHKEKSYNLSKNDLKLDQMIKNSNKNNSLKYETEYFFNVWKF